MGGDIVRAVMVSAGMLGSVMGTVHLFTYLMVWDRKYDGTTGRPGSSEVPCNL